MNIAFYTNDTCLPSKGGVENLTLFLGDYFKKKGHTVLYLSSCTDKSVFREIIAKHNIEIVINQGAINPRGCANIIEWTKQANVKLISVSHISLAQMYGIYRRESLGFIIDNPKIGAGIKNFLNRCCNFIFKLKYGKYYRRQVELSDRYVLLSDKYSDELRYFSSLKNLKNVVSIPNPFSIENSRTDDLKQKVVLFSGRFVFQKRVDLLLEIWAKINKKFPEWKLVLLGDGPLLETMKAKAIEKRLKNYSFEGFQTNPQDYYRQASILAMTSAYEGFPLVILEAMAYGLTPVVFETFDAASDIIDNGKNGFLIAPFDVDSYVEKLSFLIEFQAERQLMAKAAKIKSTDFSIENIYQKWESLFKELIC